MNRKPLDTATELHISNVEPAVGETIDINGWKFKCSAHTEFCYRCDLYNVHQSICGAIRCNHNNREDCREVVFIYQEDEDHE